MKNSELDTKKELAPVKTKFSILKNKIKEFKQTVKTIQGDPHYIAVGMAIGVFVGITPTFPFHTILAVALSFVFRGSKPAAALGVWVGNPITMPFFYLGSYRIGGMILGNSVPFDEKYISIPELLKLGLDVTAALITGGALLGILPAIFSYFITRIILTNIRSRKKTSQ
jgi:uncharacterized protein (DUF2062 family)